MSLYDDLGVKPDATKAEIRSAFRKKARSAHPDAGGTTEAFQSVELAHRILTDEEKRAHYDETGKVDDTVDTLDAQATSLIMTQLAPLLADEDAMFKDVVKVVRAELTKQKQAIETDISTFREAIARVRKMRAKFKGPVLAKLVEAQIRSAEGSVAAHEARLKAQDRAIELIAAESFTPDERPPEPELRGTNFSSVITDEYFTEADRAAFNRLYAKRWGRL